MPSLLDSRHAPFLFFSLRLKNIHFTHRINLFHPDRKPAIDGDDVLNKSALTLRKDGVERPDPFLTG
jgi:hypothetical protein